MVYSYLPKGVALLVIRIVTITMFFFIPILGDYCCQLRNQLKLLRNQNVTITSMTGWIKGPSSLFAAIRMRKLPAGLFGLLMILIAALTLVTDLVSARFVTSELMQDRCNFTRGMVSDGSLGVAQFPPFPSKGYTMASQAQSNSYYNGGQYGIYTKVADDPYFTAELNDTIGQWQCQVSGAPQKYNSQTVLDSQIALDMINKGLLYEQYWALGNTSNADPATQLKANVSWQTLIMSSNADAIDNQFKIQIAVDVVDTLDPVTKMPIAKSMQAYSCELVSYPGFEDTAGKLLEGMNPRYLVSFWYEVIRSNLYESLHDYTVGEDALLWMQWILNSATMVAGSNTGTTDTLPNTTYGCAVYVTNVPSFVIVLVALSGLFTILLAITAIVLAIMVAVASKKYDRENNGSKLSSKDLKESVPNGLVGWMVHAAQEANRAPERPDERGLTKWRLTSRDFDNHRLRMVHAKANTDTENMVQRPRQEVPRESNAFMGSNYSQNSSGFFGQKTGYESVNTRDSH